MAAGIFSSVAATVMAAATTSLVATVGLFIARWKIDQISRKELIESTAQWRQEAQDNKAFLEERDRRLAELKGQIESLEESGRRMQARIEMMNGEIVKLAAERLRRDRHITRLCRLLREKGVEPPLLDE